MGTRVGGTLVTALRGLFLVPEGMTALVEAI
jgi:hypothetical protein